MVSGVAVFQVETIREHIRAFKQDNGVDKVVILWTANTERYAQVSYPEPRGMGQQPIKPRMHHGTGSSDHVWNQYEAHQ